MAKIDRSNILVIWECDKCKGYLIDKGESFACVACGYEEPLPIHIGRVDDLKGITLTGAKRAKNYLLFVAAEEAVPSGYDLFFDWWTSSPDRTLSVSEEELLG